VTKRQYWTRDGKAWKIFFEGVIWKVIEDDSICIRA
jgi:hypothetical protein